MKEFTSFADFLTKVQDPNIQFEYLMNFGLWTGWCLISENRENTSYLFIVEIAGVSYLVEMITKELDLDINTKWCKSVFYSYRNTDLIEKYINHNVSTEEAFS